MFLSVILPLVLIAAFIAGAISSRHRLLRLVHRNLYLYIGSLFASSYIVGTVSLYLCENRTNPHFANLADSFWSVTIYILSGFEDRPPETFLGRIISVFIFLLALAVVGSVAGKFASAFIAKEKITMPSDISGQIVICNWNIRGDRIIKELHAAQAVPNTEIVVISDAEINETELRGNSAYANVYFVRSDPVLHDVLESSRVHLARSVIILADESTPDPDAKSALVALALQSICRKLGVSKVPHIVAEAINHRKQPHLINAGVEEIICATDFGLGVLAQCALHAKLSNVYSELLTYGDDTNEIYIVTPEHYSPGLVGKTFPEAATLLNNHRDADNPAVLIGIRRDDKVLVNPRRGGNLASGHALKIEDGDALIVISYDQPDLTNVL